MPRQRVAQATQRGSSSVNIRVFDSADEAAVIELWQRCELVQPWNDPANDIARKQAFQPDLFLVGLEGEKIMATVMAGYEGHRGWVNYLAVDPEQRRQGFGRAIMARAEELLAEVGCPKVNLQVRGDNEAVISFYRKLGYQVEDRASLGKRLEADTPR